ncbi:hypothetical protein, partial [Brevibacterium samyangense]|uniref:hypothetical protein n=1 Tax=Brevibacterium samyangense TaxID=366888 RepID=UPI0031DA237F
MTHRRLQSNYVLIQIESSRIVVLGLVFPFRSPAALSVVMCSQSSSPALLFTCVHEFSKGVSVMAIEPDDASRSDDASPSSSGQHSKGAPFAGFPDTADGRLEAFDASGPARLATVAEAQQAEAVAFFGKLEAVAGYVVSEVIIETTAHDTDALANAVPPAALPEFLHADYEAIATTLRRWGVDVAKREAEIAAERAAQERALASGLRPGSEPGTDPSDSSNSADPSDSSDSSTCSDAEVPGGTATPGAGVGDSSSASASYAAAAGASSSVGSADEAPGSAKAVTDSSSALSVRGPFGSVSGAGTSAKHRDGERPDVEHRDAEHWGEEPGDAEHREAEPGATEGTESPVLVPLPALKPTTALGDWVREHLTPEHMVSVSAVLRKTIFQAYGYCRDALTVVHGLPRFFARAKAGEFGVDHVLNAARIAGRVPAALLSKVDNHLATRRADVTPETFRVALNKLVRELVPREVRAAKAFEERRVDVEHYGNGTGALILTGPSLLIEACFRRVEALARSVFYRKPVSAAASAPGNAHGAAEGRESGGAAGGGGAGERMELIEHRNIAQLMFDILSLSRPQVTTRRMPTTRHESETTDLATGEGAEELVLELPDAGDYLRNQAQVVVTVPFLSLFGNGNGNGNEGGSLPGVFPD